MTTSRTGGVRGLLARVVITAPALCLLACTSGATDGSATSPAPPGGGTATSRPPASVATSRTPTTPISPTTPPTTSASSAASAPETVPCTPTVAEVFAEGGLAGVGHTGFLVHVRNASHQPCVTIGYPGVDLLAGDEATAVVEGAAGGGAGACANAAAIRFTLPDNTDSTVLRVSFPVCGDVEIHPLLAGDTGSA